jgi:hypothetical protein
MKLHSGHPELFFSCIGQDKPWRGHRVVSVVTKFLGYEIVEKITTASTDFLGDLPKFALKLQGLIIPVKHAKNTVPEECGSYDCLVAGDGPDRLLCQFEPDTPVPGFDWSDLINYGGAPDFHDYIPIHRCMAEERVEISPKPYVDLKKQARLVCLLLISTAYPGDISSNDEEEGLVLEQYGKNPNDYIRIGHFYYERRLSTHLDEKRRNRTLFEAGENGIIEEKIRIF